MREIYYLIAGIAYTLFIIQFILSWIGAKFVKDLMSNITPAVDMITTGMKEPLQNLFGKSKQLPEKENFEEAK